MADVAPTQAIPAPALGRAVGRGMSFNAMNSVLSKVISFGAFTILGWLLSKEDFGLYAMAFSVAAFLQVFRDGGVVQLLIQRNEAEYESLLGPVFWMALTFNTGTAAVLSVIAPVVAWKKEAPQLAPLIWVLAIALPLATPSVVLSARLQKDLRFGYLSAISFVSSIIRYGGTVTLAYLHFGPMSFVLPMPVIAIYEGVAYYVATKQSPWKRRPQLARWRELFAHSKWLIFFSLAVAALNQGSYLAIGAIIPIDRLGVFSFAFQLISQVDALLGTIGTVLFPALARLNDDPERQRNATIRAIRILMFLACPAALGLAAVVDPLEQLLWHGNWHEAVWPVQALAVFYAARILITAPNAALQARGMFRGNAMITLFAGLGMTACAGTAALVWGTPNWIAQSLTVGIGVFCGGLSVIGLKWLLIGRRRVVGAVAPAWVIAVVAAAASIGADRATRGRFDEIASVVAGKLGSMIPKLASAPWAASAVDAAFRLALAFVVYCAVYGLVFRIAAPKRLVEALVIVPGRLRHVAVRAALLHRHAV